MTTVVEKQTLVLENWVAREREYMEENEFDDTEALTVLVAARALARGGKAMDELEIEQFALKYYDATIEDLYGDTDGSDELEADLMNTLS